MKRAIDSSFIRECPLIYSSGTVVCPTKEDRHAQANRKNGEISRATLYTL
jgi:hypothetical protein